MANSISVAALTWNMAHTTAVDKVVETFVADIRGKELVTIATQEERAYPWDTVLCDKILNKLNIGLTEEEKYILVEENYMFTAAGGTFPLTNKVRAAMLVKKPLKLNKIKTQIAKERLGKGSIIISGELEKEGEAIPVTFSAVHLESNEDSIRRKQANDLLRKTGLITDKGKSREEIEQEASSLHLVQGDFNERLLLRKDGTTRGPTDNFSGYGFDNPRIPEVELIVETESQEEKVINTNATYSPCIDGRHVASEIKRFNRANDGGLDQIKIATGFEVEQQQLKIAIPAGSKVYQRGTKTTYEGADHFPVVRTFQVNLEQKEKLVSRHIARRIPDLSTEIKEMQSLKQVLEDLSIGKRGMRVREIELAKLATFIGWHEVVTDFSQIISPYIEVRPKASTRVREVLAALNTKIKEKQEDNDKLKVVKQKLEQGLIEDKNELEKLYKEINELNEGTNERLCQRAVAEEKMAKKNKRHMQKNKTVALPVTKDKVITKTYKQGQAVLATTVDLSKEKGNLLFNNLRNSVKKLAANKYSTFALNKKSARDTIVCTDNTKEKNVIAKIQKEDTQLQTNFYSKAKGSQIEEIAAALFANIETGYEPTITTKFISKQMQPQSENQLRIMLQALRLQPLPSQKPFKFNRINLKGFSLEAICNVFKEENKDLDAKKFSTECGELAVNGDFSLDIDKTLKYMTSNLKHDVDKEDHFRSSK